MSKRHKNLQPWLDYFELLHSYEMKGLLNVLPEKHEAYVTLPALHAMSDGDDPQRQLAGAVQASARRIHAYCGWLSREGIGYLSRPFALHVVKDSEPHDLLYTLLFSAYRRWWWPWREIIKVEAVSYG